VPMKLLPGRGRFDPGSSGVLASGSLFRMRAILWATLLFATILGLFFASVFGARWLGLRGYWVYAPPIVLPVFACWTYTILVQRFERRRAAEIVPDASSVPEILVGFALGGALITAMWLLLWSWDSTTYSAGHGRTGSRVWFSTATSQPFLRNWLSELPSSASWQGSVEYEPELFYPRFSLASLT